TLDPEKESAEEKKLASSIRSRDELLKFARDCWSTADKVVASLTDAQLTANVKTPFGFNPPGHVIFNITSDEFLHHRGQLYAYARALGIEPPMVWDFEHNEAEFRPKADARV